jgi:hypothetical protein
LGSQGSKARPVNRRVAQWMRDNVRLPGIPDEFIAPDGRRVRSGAASSMPSPRWRLRRSSGVSDRPIATCGEAGVTYRAPGETADRALAVEAICHS